MARAIRDEQWEILERAAALGTVWICLWNKERRPTAADEFRFSLIGGMETWSWFSNAHPDWFSCGDWSAERYAFPATITDAGRAALADRAAHDLEPVEGGLVEPGWQAVPLPPEEARRG